MIRDGAPTSEASLLVQRSARPSCHCTFNGGDSKKAFAETEEHESGGIGNIVGNGTAGVAR